MKQFKYSGDLVTDSIQGLVSSFPFLTQLDPNVVAHRSSLNHPNKVTIVSGGGSGHEPTHAGFIGDGGIDAVAVGQTFASPSANQVQRAIEAVASPKGTLVVVKNYTGDVLHFGLAAEKSRADGANIRVLIVGEDVSVGRAQGGLVGRRGLAGVVLVHKVAGAAAKSGADLDEVEKFAKATADNIATVAASLDHCVVPGREFATDLKQNEFEVGLGIHNEPGVQRHTKIPSIPDLVSGTLLPMLLDENDKDRGFFQYSKGDKIALLVNNLGGLSTFEISYVTSIVLKALKADFDIKPVRVYSGTFTTAFNGPGFSITLLNLTKAGPKIIGFLDAPAKLAGWTSQSTPEQWEEGAKNPIEKSSRKSHTTSALDKSSTKLPAGFAKALDQALHNVIAAEPEITRYDTVAGDGDAGETLKAGAEAVLQAISKKDIDVSEGANAAVALTEISDTAGEAMGGTSGGIYAIFLAAFAQNVAKDKASVLGLKEAAAAGQDALKTLFSYTKARVGHRTLVDALDPYINTLSKTGDAKAALKAADDGAKSTAGLRAKAGRAAYVQQDDLASGNVPDPGAYGLVELLKGLSLAKS